MDIEKHVDENLGGNYSLRYTFIESVLSIPETLDGVIHQAVELKPNAKWFEVYCTEHTLQVKESPIESDQGAAFDREVTGFVPKERAELINALERIKNRACIVDVIDNNRVRKLVGTVEEPLYFTSSFDSKPDPAGRSGYAITFKGPGISKSPVYNI